jgi:D-xylose transport system substrate-binding protein
MQSNKTNAIRRTAAAVALCAVTCALPDSAYASSGKPLIAVAMQKQQEQRWAFDRVAMEAEAKKVGADIVFQYANGDPIKQMSEVENMLNRQPDALILNPVNSRTAGEIVNSAHAAGVPVIAYDTGVETAKVDYYVTRDNYKVGQLQIQAAMKFAPSGNYAIVRGDASDQTGRDISKAYDDRLKGQQGIKVVFDQNIASWSPAKAQTAAEDAMSANKDQIRAFVVTNDGMASGVAQVLKSRNLQGKVFLSGNDAESASLKLIAQGMQTMTVYTDINEMARSAVRAAVALAKKQSPTFDAMVDIGAGKVPTRLIPVMAITKDNLCDAIKDTPKGWTSAQQVFGRDDACH